MPRIIYCIRYVRKDGLWIVTESGAFRNSCGVKYVLVGQWRRICRSRWDRYHEPSQLRVFGKNGRIQFEHTYGRDPKRSKG